MFKKSNVTQEVINSAYNGSNLALKTPKTNETPEWENHNNMDHDSLDAEDNEPLAFLIKRKQIQNETMASVLFLCGQKTCKNSRGKS